MATGNQNFNFNSASNLIVNYLPQNMTDGELYSMFVTIGPVQSCRVMKDFKTNYSFGFGFVNYTRPEDAERAIQQLNGTEIFNKRIKVSYARPSGDDIKGTNLYVTNLPKNITEEGLQTIFEPYGKIVQKNVLLDKTTRMPRGVAFVRYNLREEAQNAIRNLDGTTLEGGVDRLSVRVAEEHGKQKAAYYAGWQAGLQQGRGGRDVRGGRGLPRGGPPRGGMMRGRGANNIGGNFNNNLVQYPIQTTNGFGALRQERLNQRYNPLTYGGNMQNNVPIHNFYRDTQEL